VSSKRSQAILAELYRDLKCPILFTDPTTAELIKYTANAYLATKISFINMVADVCEAVGADITQVATGLGLDSRIGTQFLNAGLGFGGYCLPKDLRAFVHLAEEHNVDCSLLRETENINNARVERLLRKIREALWVVRGKTVGVLGLAFKAATDDVRDAPAFKVIAGLLREGAKLKLFDPKAMENAKATFPDLIEHCVLCKNAYDAATGTDALLILTEWSEFKQLDLVRLRNLVHIPILVDGRNLLDPGEARAAGFDYFCMGRSTRPPALLFPEADTGERGIRLRWPAALESAPSLDILQTTKGHDGQQRRKLDTQAQRRERSGRSVQLSSK
jgi:UDPglucose 6-dehydrogenase